MNTRKFHTTAAVLAGMLIVAGASFAQMPPAPGAAPIAAPSGPAPAATPAMPHPNAPPGFPEPPAPTATPVPPMGASPVPPMGNSPVPPMDSTGLTPLPDPMGKQAGATQSATAKRIPTRSHNASAPFRMLD